MYKKLLVFELSDFEHFKIAILGYVCEHIMWRVLTLVAWPGSELEKNIYK